jgi:RimJ/RimL family protein N-acetyltransferase
MVCLSPLSSDDVTTVAGWLARPEIGKWLDFGPGHERLDSLALKFMLTRQQYHVLFTFTPEAGGQKIGVVALSNLHRAFGTAMLWYALGDPTHGSRGRTTRAVSELLSVGFEQLGLGAINAWTVSGNEASRRVLEKNGFTLIGRQRRCHLVDGKMRDRLLFDLLSAEFTGRKHA